MPGMTVLEPPVAYGAVTLEAPLRPWTAPGPVVLQRGGSLEDFSQVNTRQPGF